MRIFTKRIMLLCIAVLFSFNLAKAEDWDCVVVNNNYYLGESTHTVSFISKKNDDIQR